MSLVLDISQRLTQDNIWGKLPLALLIAGLIALAFAISLLVRWKNKN